MDKQLPHSNGSHDNGTRTAKEESQTANTAPQGDIALDMDSVQELLGQVSENASEFLSEAKEAVEKTVKQYPIQSALVCFGVGCLIGAFLNRK